MLATTFKLLKPVAQVLKYVLPYTTMASNRRINFDTKHLKKGDPLPPYNGKLRVYNMRYCPFAQRTILALNAKNIDYEVINVNLMEKPEWLTSKSFFGKVPAIEMEEGVVLCESLITVEYLDEIYPERPLISKDPYTRAFDNMIIEATNPIFTLFYKIHRAPEDVTEEHISKYYGALDFVQNELNRRGTKFLNGIEPGFADYMIWPWFERITIFADKMQSIKIDNQNYGRLTNYLQDMFQDPVVREYLVPNDVMKKFLQSYKDGNVNYDILTKE